MLNEDRVILMTKLASYEEKEGKECLETTRYFRGDYIAAELIKSLISATLIFFMVLGLYVLYDFDTIMENIYKMDLLAYGKNILTYYCWTVVVYGICCYGLCTYRYMSAKKSLKKYAHNLKVLGSYYVKK